MTIPFPIPREDFDHCIELLKALEISSGWPILGRLEGTNVDLDELDYLAKRLDSFDGGEVAQFQAMTEALDLSDMKDLINLTFCYQQTTVITDFSDLEAIGQEHYMNTHDGCVDVQELEDLDGTETAILLIDGGGGRVIRYGVVYDNGMKLDQSYDGRHFPAYLYEPPKTTLANDGAVFLFQFHKNSGFPLRTAIAAQAQLFFINGLFQTPADEPEIRSVQIEVADRTVAVCVGTQTSSSGGEQLGLLAPGHQILELIPLKDGLLFHDEILLVSRW